MPQHDAFLCAVAAAALLSACATSKPIDQHSAQTGSSAVTVLVGLSAEIEGKKANPFSGNSKVMFKISNLDEESGPVKIRPAALPTGETAGTHWGAFSLKPGAYHLQVVYPWSIELS